MLPACRSRAADPAWGGWSRLTGLTQTAMLSEVGACKGFSYAFYCAGNIDLPVGTPLASRSKANGKLTASPTKALGERYIN